MSNRTIIEINHDFALKLDAERFDFMNLIGRVLRNSEDKPAWDELKRYGVTRHATVHHTDERVLYINGRAAQALREAKIEQAEEGKAG